MDAYHLAHTRQDDEHLDGRQACSRRGCSDTCPTKILYAPILICHHDLLPKSGVQCSIPMNLYNGVQVML